MAHTLLLVRHAKAVHDGTADPERPLAARGRRDAAAAGRWLAAHDLVPDHVVTSPALRAVQTWEGIESTIGATPPVTVDDRVYDNTIESLLAAVRAVADDVNTVALVGHNPSMQAFAVALDDGGGDADARSEIREAYPTSGITVLDCDIGWSGLNRGGGIVREFVTPRGARADRS